MLRIILISLLGLVAGAPLDQPKSTCEVCYSLVNELQDYLSNSQSKTSIEDYVKDLCVKLPSEEKDVCLGFTRDYAGLFFTKLNSDLTPQQLCDKIPDICPSTDQEVENADLDVHGPVECAICELAVLGIDAAVKEDASSADISTSLEKFCDGLPAPLSATCKKIEGEIQAGLTQGFDSKTSCRFVNLCPADTDDTIRHISCDDCHQAIDAIGITDTGKICKHLKSCDTSKEEEVLQQPSVGDDAACEICELIVEFIDQELQDNKTSGVINSTLYEVCKALPDPLNSTCITIIPVIENGIAGGIDPKTACTATNFCPKGLLSNACDLCMETANRNEDGKLNEQFLDATCTKLCHKRERRSLNKQASSSKPCPECKDVACTACKLLLDGVNGIVGANFTVETVDKTMTDICNRMAGESTQDACLRAVPKIVELLEKGVSPEDACKIVGLCTKDDQVRSSTRKTKKTALRGNMKKIFHTTSSEAVTVNDDLECEICKKVGDVVNWLLKDNVTDTTVNSTLYTVCINLPATSLQNMCFSAGSKLLQAMKQGLDVTDACVKFEFCDTKAKEGKTKMTQALRSVFQRPVQVNLRCDTCEFVVDELDKILADNGTDVQINDTVYGICAKLQGALMDLCLEAAPKLVQTIEDGTDPKSSCMLIKLCDSNTATYVIEPQPQQVDLKCDTCQFIITELDKVLADNGTDVKINSTVFSICSQLGGALKDLCLQAAPQVVNQVEKGAEPNKTCVLVKLCDATTPKVEEMPAVLKANPLECGICEFVIKEIDAALQKNGSFEKINDTVYEICENLGELKTQCLAFAPSLVNAIEKGGDPKETCTAIKLCDSQEVQAEAVQPKMDSNLECDLCKYVVDEIDKRIVTNATDQKINETVYKLCDGLDSSLKGACLLLAPSIVQEIEKGADAEKVCEKIGACKSSAEEQTTMESGPQAEPWCTLCKDAIMLIDDELKKNGSDEKINSTVYGVCNDLDGTLKTLCLGVAPQLVSALENGADPDKACEAIKACDTRDESVSLNRPEKEHIDCEMCQKTLQYVYKNIEQDYPKVQRVLMQICDRLPVNYGPMCVSMLDEDNGKMFKSILQSYTPVSMCEMAECVENHVSEISSLS